MPYSVEFVATPIAIPMEDAILHTEGRPFCTDSTCPCRNDIDNLYLLSELIASELLTTEEADLVMRGATI